MLATPDYSHLRSAHFDSVYDPAEDTFLLLDALELDMTLLKTRTPTICLEIGCGSGVVINFLAKHLTPPLCLATDINELACEAARRTAQLNGTEASFDVINCDLTEAIEARVHGQVDVLLFNPPYVPTDDTELGSRALPAAWAGGHNGCQVMRRVFQRLDTLLSPTGLFYLVCIKQNNVADIETELAALGFDTCTVIERKAGIERLYVLRISRHSET